MEKFEINREDYINGNIFQVGDIVEDLNTGKVMQILDRGTNYLTVLDESTKEVVKKWIKDVKPTQESLSDKPVVDNGQIKWGVTVTEHLDETTAEVLAELFEETEDHFAWRQAVVTLDGALSESDNHKKYELLTRVETFLDNMGCDESLPIVAEQKSVAEQKRIAELIANAAETSIAASPTETIEQALSKFEGSKLNESQWKVIDRLLEVAKKMGIQFKTKRKLKEEDELIDTLFTLIEQSLDEFDDTLVYEDLFEEFDESEFDTETFDENQINETLTYASRLKLAQAARRRSAQLHLAMKRKINRAATTKEKLGRARKMALTALKRRMFRKDVKDLSPQEKARFEMGAKKRTALVSRIAQRMLKRVNAVQAARLHN
ncbi:hypothetical protein [Synechococcus phage BUCT-ZZ01]|nr:hypothetical protein [Synechococcus phage BUCT-ZZ01]